MSLMTINTEILNSVLAPLYVNTEKYSMTK